MEQQTWTFQMDVFHDTPFETSPTQNQSLVKVFYDQLEKILSLLLSFSVGTMVPNHDEPRPKPIETLNNPTRNHQIEDIRELSE